MILGMLVFKSLPMHAHRHCYTVLFTKHGYVQLSPPPLRARGVVVSHPLSMREALGSIPSVSNRWQGQLKRRLHGACSTWCKCITPAHHARGSGLNPPCSQWLQQHGQDQPVAPACEGNSGCGTAWTSVQTHTAQLEGALRGARGVVVSHPLSMREALGSIPSVSIF